MWTVQTPRSCTPVQCIDKSTAVNTVKEYIDSSRYIIDFDTLKAFTLFLLSDDKQMFTHGCIIRGE